MRSHCPHLEQRTGVHHQPVPTPTQQRVYVAHTLSGAPTYTMRPSSSSQRKYGGSVPGTGASVPSGITIIWPGASGWPSQPAVGSSTCSAPPPGCMGIAAPMCPGGLAMPGGAGIRPCCWAMPGGLPYDTMPGMAIMPAGACGLPYGGGASPALGIMPGRLGMGAAACGAPPGAMPACCIGTSCGGGGGSRAPTGAAPSSASSATVGRWPGEPPSLACGVSGAGSVRGSGLGGATCRMPPPSAPAPGGPMPSIVAMASRLRAPMSMMRCSILYRL
eukprot:363847-Chlamydomonas_euryale.AAC.1